MSSTDLIMGAAGASSGPVNYVDDVFSTYLYTGNGSTQTITNGIDLAGKGGMVWIKSRSQGENHLVVDTVRGATNRIQPNVTNASVSSSTHVTSFTSSGFVVDLDNQVNGTSLGGTYASWTFRKAPKFFDVVTFTGTTGNQTISHNLGSAPGMIIIKSTSNDDSWFVQHKDITDGYLTLNSTNEKSGTQTPCANVTSTSFDFKNDVFGAGTGATYVAYLFAHDAGGFGAAGTDNVISCGSFTTNASGAATINLGYEPQYLMVKQLSGTGGNWFIVDVMRGFNVSGTTVNLNANASTVEGATVGTLEPTSTGFRSAAALNVSQTYIYMAIRRPMKPPTSGTEVFQPVAYTGTNVDNRLVDTGIVTDMAMARIRTSTSDYGFLVGDRLRSDAFLSTATFPAEATDLDTLMTPTSGYGNSFSAQNGFGVGNDATAKLNQSSTTQIAYAFQRKPGFFDEVCYTGTGIARTVTHNLGVVPELYIIKRRNGSNRWIVAGTVLPSSTNRYLHLELTNGFDTIDEIANLFQTPTSTTIGFGSGSPTMGEINASGGTYVAYLFASIAGVSKVFSFTGNGSSQTINCGFAGGARFVMIKRTDSTGDWFVWDTARGIASGNDPHLSLNTTAAEVTTDDSIDPDSSGFVVNQLAATNINVSSATYIGIAIS